MKQNQTNGKPTPKPVIILGLISLPFWGVFFIASWLMIAFDPDPSGKIRRQAKLDKIAKKMKVHP